MGKINCSRALRKESDKEKLKVTFAVLALETGSSLNVTPAFNSKSMNFFFLFSFVTLCNQQPSEKALSFQLVLLRMRNTRSAMKAWTNHSTSSNIRLICYFCFLWHCEGSIFTSSCFRECPLVTDMERSRNQNGWVEPSQNMIIVASLVSACMPVCFSTTVSCSAYWLCFRGMLLATNKCCGIVFVFVSVFVHPDCACSFVSE